MKGPGLGPSHVGNPVDVIFVLSEVKISLFVLRIVDHAGGSSLGILIPISKRMIAWIGEWM